MVNNALELLLVFATQPGPVHWSFNGGRPDSSDRVDDDKPSHGDLTMKQSKVVLREKNLVAAFSCNTSSPELCYLVPSSLGELNLTPWNDPL